MDSKGFLNPNPNFGKGEDEVQFLNQLPKLIIIQKPKGTQNFICPRRNSVNIPNENNIEVEHEVASEWDCLFNYLEKKKIFSRASPTHKRYC